MRKINKLIINILLIIIVSLFSFLICLHYGRIGFMPLDQSIVFDGAWRILSGQIPFRDFYTPIGLTPIFIQALFFKYFGLSWFCYVLHAAIFNSIFCILIFSILRLLGASYIFSFFYC